MCWSAVMYDEVKCSDVWCGTVCTQRGQAFIVNDLPVAKRDDVREL